jgi:hypothetical protein
VDLIAWFALAYVWQCALAVRTGWHLLAQRFDRWEDEPGGGWRLTPLWPSALSLVAAANALGPEAFSVERFQAAFERARTATRSAAFACDLYLLAVVGGLPALLLALGEERVLRIALPGVLALHAATWLLVLRARGRLAATPNGAPRWEFLVAAALYPPALLRAPHDLAAAELAGFHPMTARAGLWERARFVERVQQALARLEAGAPEAGLDAAALQQLAAAQDVGPHELAAPRPHADPEAASYCTRCLSDYRPGFRRCADCGGQTTPYPGCG